MLTALFPSVASERFAPAEGFCNASSAASGEQSAVQVAGARQEARYQAIEK